MSSTEAALASEGRFLTFGLLLPNQACIMYTHMRRTVVARQRDDGSVGRDIDQVLGKSMFGVEGRHGSPESERAKARAYSFSTRPEAEEDEDDTAATQLCLFEAEAFRLGFLAELEQELPALQQGGVFPYEGLTIGSLVKGIEAYLAGMPYSSQAPTAALRGVATLVGRALKVDRPSPDPEGSGVLFGEPLPSPLSRLHQIKKGSVERVAATWLARERAKWLQSRSDPDLPRLRAFEHAVAEDLDLSVTRTWWDLVSWRWGAPERVATRADSVDWDPGLVRCYKLLQEELELTHRSLAKLRELCETKGHDPSRGLDAIGYVSIFDATRGAHLLRRKIAGAKVTPVMAVEGAHRPSLCLGSIGELRLREIARRRGWLVGDIEEPTLIERAMRGVRADATSVSPARRLSDEALFLFAEEGDGSGIVEALRCAGDVLAPTHYTLQVEGVDATCEQVTSLGRLAAEGISGRPLDAVPDFAAAVFGRYPRHIVTEGSELATDGKFGKPELSRP